MSQIPTEPMKLPRGPRTGDKLPVAIDTIAPGGVGIGSLSALVGPQADARTYRVEVRKAVPGDVVMAHVEDGRKSRIKASIDHLITPSPMRKPARCQHFGLRHEPGKGCGGCTLQSVDYRHQLLIKERMVKHLMQRAGVDPGLVAPTLGCDDPWFYRNKMEFSFGDDGARQFALGLHPSGYRHDVLNLRECYLQSEASARLVRVMSDWSAEAGLEPFHGNTNLGFLRTLTVRESERTGERLINITTTDDPEAMYRGALHPARDIVVAMADALIQLAAQQDVTLTSIVWTRHRAVRGERTSFHEEVLLGDGLLREVMLLHGERALRFEIHPRAFFQPNTRQAERLYNQVLEHVSEAGQLNTLEVLDLYCGTGTIGLSLAHWVRRVRGIELSVEAVDNAHKNARNNGLDNVEFYAGDVGEQLAQRGIGGAQDPVDVVIVDPPRAGLLPPAREQIERVNARRIVYVSCNPETLARDLVLLRGAGYQIEAVQPVDMFPQTHHVECVASLARV